MLKSRPVNGNSRFSPKAPREQETKPGQPDTFQREQEKNTVILSKANDVVTGSSSADVFDGAGGNDIIDGYLGDDTALFFTSFDDAKITVDRVSGITQVEYGAVNNSEYAFTQSGNTVRLRNPDGGLTARGREMYQEPEITVEVPAIQMGTNKLNERSRIGTHKVFTENEFPEIGEIFRRAASQEEGVRACLLYTSPSPRDRQKSRMPSSA